MGLCRSVTAMRTGAQMSCLHCSTFFPFFLMFYFICELYVANKLYICKYMTGFSWYIFSSETSRTEYSIVQAVINSMFLTTKTILSLQSLQRVNTFMFVNVQYFNLCPIPIVAIVHISNSISIGLKRYCDEKTKG